MRKKSIAKKKKEKKEEEEEDKKRGEKKRAIFKLMTLKKPWTVGVGQWLSFNTVGGRN